MLLFSMPSLAMASSGFSSQNLIDVRTKKSTEVALRFIITIFKIIYFFMVHIEPNVAKPHHLKLVLLYFIIVSLFPCLQMNNTSWLQEMLMKEVLPGMVRLCLQELLRSH